MDEYDLVRTISILSRFSPPDGAVFAVVVQPDSRSAARVTVFLATSGERKLNQCVPIDRTPTDADLQRLYLAARELVAAAADATPAAALLGLDLGRVGGD